VLIGHSMGGLVATRYAQLHGSELAALVLSGPAIGGNPGIEALLAMDPIPDLPIDPSTLSRDPEVGRAYLEDPLVWHGPFRRATLEALFAAVRTIAAGPRLGPLPTLWLHGEDDALTPLAETRAAIERVRGERLESIVYPGARHEVLNETNRDDEANFAHALSRPLQAEQLLDAIAQVTTGANGMLEALTIEADLLKGMTRSLAGEPLSIVPVVFTTARLLITTVDLSSASLKTGLLPVGEFQASEVPWLFLTTNQSVDLKHERGTSASRPPRDLRDIIQGFYERTIAVVSPDGIDDFLEMKWA